MQNKIDNSEAYGTLRWILDNGDMGFFFVIASHHQQKKVAGAFKSLSTAVYDYSHESKPFSCANLCEWADTQNEKDALFILNLDLALTDDKGYAKDHMANFNISRNLLAKKEKIWIFFMTDEMHDRLAKFAHDIYSYVRLKVYFQTEEEDEFEGKYILDFDNRHNIQQVKETLNRHKELEARYMDMSVDENSESQLLSAAVSLTKIAILYSDCAEYDNALMLFEKTREIREKVLGNQNPDTAEVYNNIALTYNQKGDYIRALDWYYKSLVIKEKVFGKEHPSTATTYNNIASAYDDQHDYNKALEFHQKALSVREKILGNEHTDTATTYNNIAHLYRNQGEYSKALDFFQKALRIIEKTLSKEHPNTAANYNNIALVYNSQGEHSKALEWHQKALIIREEVLGKEHPDTANTYNNIALVYYNQGDYDKASEWYQKAYNILLLRLGEGHPNTITVKNNMQFLNQKISQNKA